MSLFLLLPPEIIQKIADYLEFKDEKNFYYSHNYFSMCLKNFQILDVESNKSLKSIYRRLENHRRVRFKNLNDILYFPINSEFHILV